MMAGCSSEPLYENEAAVQANNVVETVEGLSADLRDINGETLARATLEQTGDAVRVRIDAAGLPAGTYGAHVHMTGRCDAPDFASAGGHWNPTDHRHGRDNPQGAHMGDLPNLVVAADGSGAISFDITGATLRGAGNPVMDEDGAAVIVHADPDDYRTDPSGNSGARIACGVIG
ncbi:MAG: superoxide dismutase family protein [Sphingomonas sp.]|nr:superoxide dismutase family protein [Sphingomonas sp.]